MKLNDKQIQQLDQDGFLIIEDRFADDEVDLMRDSLATLLANDHPGNVIEQSSGVVRTSMGLHLRDDVFAKVVRHPRLVLPALQILNEDCYIQQVKVNTKAAFSGEVWALRLCHTSSGGRCRRTQSAQFAYFSG